MMTSFPIKTGKQIDEDFNKSEADGIFQRKNGKNVNVEVDTIINQKILKNINYLLKHLKSGIPMDQFVVHLDEREITNYYSDANIYAHLNIISTKKIWGPTH